MHFIASTTLLAASAFLTLASPIQKKAGVSAFIGDPFKDIAYNPVVPAKGDIKDDPIKDITDNLIPIQDETERHQAARSPRLHLRSLLQGHPAVCPREHSRHGRLLEPSSRRRRSLRQLGDCPRQRRRPRVQRIHRQERWYRLRSFQLPRSGCRVLPGSTICAMDGHGDPLWDEDLCC